MRLLLRTFDVFSSQKLAILVTVICCVHFHALKFVSACEQKNVHPCLWNKDNSSWANAAFGGLCIC
jgi:hypothetical protein